MTSEPLQWLFSLERLGMKFGLENIRTLAHGLDNPQDAFQSVLIAGTNGKGSVTAMVEHGLRAAGYRAARYTSPHLVRLEERFVIDGHEIAAETLTGAAAQMREVVERLAADGSLTQPPTFFEVATAIAFELFRAANVEIAVLEVGLGGRLDATNVVTPLVTAITTIDFDHQQQLGDTIEAIAGEKAGIVKPGVPVVIGRLPGRAEDVVVRVAAAAGAPVVRAHAVVEDLGNVRLALAGAHQVDNAIVSAALLRQLGAVGFPVPAAAERDALERVIWPGRLELLHCAGVDVLLDAAHNPAGARALASYLRSLGWTDATLIFGAMADKNAREMLIALAPSVGRIVCTTASSPRAAAPEALAAAAAEIAGDDRVEIIADPVDAMTRASATASRIVVAGSMFLIGPLRDILR